MALPLMVLGGVAAGALLGGSTSENITNTVVNTSVEVTNRAVMELSSRGRASNSLVISDTGGDVVIEGLAQDAAVTVSVEGYLQATNSTAVQQEVAQKLSQMAEAVTSGISLGGKAEAKNIVNTTINSSANILNETKVLCRSDADAENTITVARTGGNVSIRNVTQNAAVNSILKCQSSNISNTVTSQKADQSIEQTATAIVKGLDLGAMLLPLIIIGGLVILAPVVLMFGAARAVTGTTTSVINNFLGENFPAVIALLVLLGVALAVLFLLPISPLSPKGKVGVTCAAEMRGAGGCRPADDDADPALLFPFMRAERLRGELGAAVGAAQTAASLEAAVAAARATAGVNTMLWDRDAKTWQGFAGKPDPEPWTATFDEDTGTLLPSEYTEPGTRSNVLDLVRRATNLARGLYCIAAGVSGAFDPSDPSRDPSATLCRTFENNTSEGFVEVDGQRRALPRENVPDPARFEWRPLGAGGTTSNFWASADPALIFRLLRGDPASPTARISVCMNPPGADPAACSSPEFVISGITPGLAFLDEMGQVVRARLDAGSDPRVSAPLFRDWRIAVDKLRADVALGFEHYNSGDAADVETVRSVLAFFPVRVGKAPAQQQDDWKVYAVVGTIAALGIATVVIVLKRYKSVREAAREAAGGGGSAAGAGSAGNAGNVPETGSPVPSLPMRV